MDDISIFPDKDFEPTDTELVERLGPTNDLWTLIQGYVLEKYPTGLSEWNFPGKKYGWSFRIRDKKRAILISHIDNLPISPNFIYTNRNAGGNLVTLFDSQRYATR